MEKVIIGNAELWHGDCMELIEAMGNGAVDHVITDVPYHSRTHENAELSNKNDGEKEKKIDFSSINDEQFLKMFNMFLCVSNRWVVSTCDILQAPMLFGIPEFVRAGIWVKDNPMPQLTGDRPGHGYEQVVILHKKGKKRWNGGGRPAVWRFPTSSSGDYPTQKPQGLIDRFVSDFTDEGELIADFCMGSGTTGVSAVQQGRRFVGCEIRREAFEIACKRIEAAQSQGRLFA